jgi:hypothetical protein
MPDAAFGVPFVTTAICGGRVSRASLALEGTLARSEGRGERFDVTLRNNGPMTALFVEAAPLLEYRTDLFVDNNYACIPPGESRTITVRTLAPGNRSLAETGWTVTCWNADTLRVPPSARVLLYMGRRDAMCREYAGYFAAAVKDPPAEMAAEGAGIDCAKVPYVLRKEIVFVFDSTGKVPVRLRIHTADRDSSGKAVITAELNGHALHASLAPGLGLQLTDPDHLAYPDTVSFAFPQAALRAGKNRLRIGVSDGWFTWDALEVCAQ